MDPNQHQKQGEIAIPCMDTPVAAADEGFISSALPLPAEIVQDIFLACLPTHRDAFMSSTEAPLLLTQICNGWRALALGTPQIWASLTVSLHFIRKKDMQKPISEWIDRSGICPLSLTILGEHNFGAAQYQSQYECTDNLKVAAVMEILKGCSHRWRTLELAGQTFAGYMGLDDVRAPTLHSITTTWAVSQLETMKTLLQTQSLRAAAVTVLEDLNECVSYLPLCWEHLTSLSLDNRGLSVAAWELEGLSPFAALAVLRRCPRLVHFTTDLDNSLEKRFYRHPGVPAQDLVSLPALQTFTACRCSSTVGPRSLGYLFTHLSMPALRRLQLPRTSTPVEGFASSVLLLGEVATRSPLIEELDIDLAGLAHDSFIYALSTLTQLQRLTAIDLKDPRADADLPPAATTARRLLEALADAAARTAPAGVASAVVPCLLWQ